MNTVATKQSALPTKDGWRHLAAAIIHEARRDLAAADLGRTADALDFFESVWYEDLADFIGFDPDAARWRLRVELQAARERTSSVSSDIA